jgi:hypothetical protein
MLCCAVLCCAVVCSAPAGDSLGPVVPLLQAPPRPAEQLRLCVLLWLCDPQRLLYPLQSSSL